MSRRILIFSTSYLPLLGGAEVAIKEITDRIPNIEFDLITAKQRRDLPFREKIGNVNIYRLGFGISILDKLILPFEGALFARHLSKRNEYSAFWGMMITFASGAAYIFNIFSEKKVPIILTLQEGDSEKYLKTRRLGLVDLSWKLALQRTQILTVISNYLGERAKRLGFRGEVNLVPNGVDIKRFSVNLSEEERYLIRQNLGLKKEDTALVTTSRLNVKNGVADVIRALTKLPENIKFVIFGVGELENELKNLTKKLNLGHRVFFRGLADHRELSKLLKACDIFIRPSLSEGLGNSFIEAMAVGLPVIATPVGGILDFLIDNETGYFCKPGNSESIAETVRRVIADPDREKIIENAKVMVRERYDWDKIALKMKQVFDMVGS